MITQQEKLSDQVKKARPLVVNNLVRGEGQLQTEAKLISWYEVR